MRMKPTRIEIHTRTAGTMPALGHGLWANQLNDIDATQSLVRQLAGTSLEVLVDLRKPQSLAQLLAALDLCQRAGCQAWLLVVVDDANPQPQLEALAEVLARSAQAPQGILLTPAAYLNSYQPDAVWPSGPTPDDLARMGRQRLPGYRIGGGVPTYFTELNRCRPDPAHFDYLTHATSPIVHAADDLSVMQSLESLPDIVRSALYLAHGKPYRLTTSAIGAWCNPYGGQLTANPDRQRLTLSDRDPRQRSLFAAAWTLGYYAAVQRAGVDAVALWAVNEPFMAAGEGEYWPIFHVLRGMNRGQGQVALSVAASNPDVAVVAWADGESVHVWLANLTEREQRLELAGIRIDGYALLDAQTCEPASGDPGFMERQSAAGPGPLTLGPYAVLALNGQRDVECGL
jgi:hypothetical protein